ncbi:MAG TPA: GNAT family N-acetyltransferase [Rhizomicrobium sp.]|nr:GNAT family N-acetyltransferase [Rhizomicrobium sp.]
MTITLRKGREADAAAAGDVCYRAFKAIAEAHNFAPDLPNPDVGAGLLSGMIAHQGFFDIVAEIDGRIVGSNFLDERNPIAGIGPITVDPALQNAKVGRALMEAVLERARQRGFVGIRLLQAGYHNRSLSLYFKLGFDAREYVACLQGPAIGKAVPGCSVRPARLDDLTACNSLCFRIHGHDRGGELADAIAQGAASVVERAGRITGYATPVAYFGHAVGETNDDLKALIGAAQAFPGPGFLLPTRNGEMMRWCLDQGLRVMHTMTLMTIGLYNEPEGAWLPSVLY